MNYAIRIALIALLCARPALARFNIATWFQREPLADEPQTYDFDRVVQAWSDNIRTNMATETSARFRDETLVPFVRREMPNPFMPGGTESDKPWTVEARNVYEVGLRIVCGDCLSAWYPDHLVCKRAGELVARGCKEPFILVLSAFDPSLDWWGDDRKRSQERLLLAEKAIERRSDVGFLRMLLSYYRKLAAIERSGDWPYNYFEEWLRSRNFTREDEIPVAQLAFNFFCSKMNVFNGFKAFGWADKMNEARRVMNEGRTAAGQGVAASVPKNAWSTLKDRTRMARKLLDEAEAIQPGRLETERTRLWIEGESRNGRRENFDALLTSISSKRLDDAWTIWFYIWYRLYPRWSGDRDYKEMRRFAQACYDTGRHDTLIPFYYAELQCRYVRDSRTDPFRYFTTNPEVTGRCIDVCLRQATNEHACSYARLNAPFIGAAVAFYAGRYEDIAPFNRHLYRINTSDDATLGRTFSDTEGLLYCFRALAEKHADTCIRLQRMYDAGQYREALSEIERLPKDVLSDYYTGQHLGMIALNARMKTDFVEGKDVKGKIPPFFPGWWNPGWWRSGNWSFNTYQSFSWEHHLTWRAELPKAHELEFTFSPKPKSKGRPVLVVSRFVHEESHYLPINGLPFLTFIWEKDRTGVYAGNNYKTMFGIDPSRAKWKKADGKDRKIRIVCDGTVVKVFVDGDAEPLLATSRYSDAIRRAPEICYVRFRGECARISDITVRKP